MYRHVFGTTLTTLFSEQAFEHHWYYDVIGVSLVELSDLCEVFTVNYTVKWHAKYTTVTNTTYIDVSVL